jgi:hypothetical protein
MLAPGDAAMLSFLVSVAAVLVISYIALSLASRNPGAGDLSSMLARISATLREAWTRFASEFKAPWLLAAMLIALAALVLRTAFPLVLLAGGIVVFFAISWLREFRFLVHLSDDAFPGQNDKLIWAILMIVLPPVGVWLFHSYREAHWPETKAGEAGAHGELG